MVVGIVSIGVYIPETKMTAEEICRPIRIACRCRQNENGNHAKADPRSK